MEIPNQEEVEFVFGLLDGKKCGYIRQEQLHSLLYDLGYDLEHDIYANVLAEEVNSLERSQELKLLKVLLISREFWRVKNFHVECRNAFTSMDFSCTGVVSMKDIRDTFAMITKQAIIERKEKIVTHLNGHKKETINIKEFIDICRLLFKSKAKEEIVYVSHTLAIFAFEALDSEKKGAIDTKHVKDALNLMMFKNVDQPEDFYYKWDLGKEIDMDEFFDRMKENREYMTE